jgi:hypothetical protein
VIDRYVRAVDAIVVDDGSGNFATVHLAGATFQMTEQSLFQSSPVPSERGSRPSSPAEFYSEATLRSGDRILVVGTRAPSHGDAYRGTSASIALTSAAGELLLFDRMTETEAHRRQVRLANVGIAVFGFASAVTIGLGLLAPS